MYRVYCGNCHNYQPIYPTHRAAVFLTATYTHTHLHTPCSSSVGVTVPTPPRPPFPSPGIRPHTSRTKWSSWYTHTWKATPPRLWCRPRRTREPPPSCSTSASSCSYHLMSTSFATSDLMEVLYTTLLIQSARCVFFQPSMINTHTHTTFSVNSAA